MRKDVNKITVFVNDKITNKLESNKKYINND